MYNDNENTKQQTIFLNINIFLRVHFNFIIKYYIYSVNNIFKNKKCDIIFSHFLFFTHLIN